MSSASSAPNPADVVRASHCTPRRWYPRKVAFNPSGHGDASLSCGPEPAPRRVAMRSARRPVAAAGDVPSADGDLAGERRAQGLRPGEPARVAIAGQPPGLGVDDDPASADPQDTRDGFGGRLGLLVRQRLPVEAELPGQVRDAGEGERARTAGGRGRDDDLRPQAAGRDQVGRPFGRDPERREPFPRRAQELRGLGAAQRPVAPDALQRRPVAGGPAQQPLLRAAEKALAGGVTARRRSLAARPVRSCARSGRPSPSGGLRRITRRAAAVPSAASAARSAQSAASGSSRRGRPAYGRSPITSRAPGRPQQRVRDRVEELRDARVRCRRRVVQGEPPAVPAVGVQGRVDAPRGDRFQGRPSRRMPRSAPSGDGDRAVEGGQDRQGGQDG